MIKSNSVLIHCSDGWDRTSQLTSLSQLLSDPYYRTIEGFCILIEKEWVSYGHMFAYRNRMHIEELNENNYSQIFIQWLDCVYQLTNQFCNKFEFKVNLLEYIARHIYSGKYGTFLYNNERDRKKSNAKTKTVSIWTDVLNKEKRLKYKNPFYDEPSKNIDELDIIIPDCTIYKLVLWEEYYLKNNYIKNTNLGKFTVLNNNNELIEYNNTLDFYYDDKELTNKELNDKKIEIEELESVIIELSNKGLLDDDQINIAETFGLNLKNENI